MAPTVKDDRFIETINAINKRLSQVYKQFQIELKKFHLH